MVSAVLILAAPPTSTFIPPHPAETTVHDEFESRKSDVSALLLTMAAMAGGSILVSFLLVLFT